MNKFRLIVFLIYIKSCILSSAQYYVREVYKPQLDNHAGMHMLGIMGGVSIINHPYYSQQDVEKINFKDISGGITYIYHKQVNKWYAMELQSSIILSTVNTLPEGSVESRIKSIFPIDFRCFLGYPTLNTYVGFGIQMYSIKDYFTQLSNNIAFGFKFGFGNTDALFKRHGIIVGIKIHLPFIDHYIVTEENIVKTALTCERTNVALTAALSIDAGMGWTIKLDYELPFTAKNTYKKESITLLTRRSQSISLSILKRL